MYKYENIKKVLNYVPSGLIEEENEATLIKWALNFYNQNIRIKNITDSIIITVDSIIHWFLYNKDIKCFIIVF